ncbi:MAG: SdpI family protein [Oscillospiraceae bacterium]|nr:SdpI family protein [Oscillospiraceae bacterium]
MNDNILYLIAEIPTPVIIMIVAISMWRSPPKRSENFGYRTRRSQLSEEAWNAAQILYGKYATILFAVTFAATVIAGTVLVFIDPDEDTALILFLAITAVQVCVLMAVIAMVERKLKKLFDENGKPRGE